MSQKPYRERIRFAWLPVRLWADAQPFTRPLQVWAWWCDVHEIQTFWGDWIAYVGHQDTKA